MNHKWLLMLLAFIVATGSGCLSTNPKRFTRQVRGWAPPGITVAEATNIMQQHGFRCDYQRFNTNSWAWWEDFKKHGNYRPGAHREPWPGDVIQCYRRSEGRNTMWIAYLQFQDGKLVSYGPPSISSDPLRIFSNMH